MTDRTVDLDERRGEGAGAPAEETLSAYDGRRQETTSARAAAADALPRLNAMRRLIGARSFAVFSLAAASNRLAAQFHTVIDTSVEATLSAVVNGRHARMIGTHVDASARPLAWCGTRGRLAIAVESRNLIARRDLGGDETAGIAFPVRLAGLGTGLVAFEASALTLAGTEVFSVHRIAYRMMGDLMAAQRAHGADRSSLSERELACLKWAGDGHTSEAIAEKLGLSVHTVNAYLGAATAKLDSVNRIQAIAKAIRLGYIA